MSLVVDLEEMVDTHLGVLLRGRERSVAEEFLDGAEIGAGIEEMSGKGVSEGVRRGATHDIGVEQALLEIALDTAGGQSAAAMIEKEWLLLPRSPPLCQIIVQGCLRLAADRHDPLFSPLTEDPDQSLGKIEMADVKSHRFAHPQAAGIEEFDDRPIAQ